MTYKQILFILCFLFFLYSFQMYFQIMYYIIFIFLFNLTFIQCQSSFCAQYYPNENLPSNQQCECDDYIQNGTTYLSLKCSGHSYVPHFLPNIFYQSIELEFCSQDLQVGDKTFADLNINTLRFRHCNLIGLNEESFSKINHLEKFAIENSTINSLLTSNGNFQEIFYADSFRHLKSLTLKNVHYHQIHKHDKKLNLEYLLHQLPQIHRLELMNIYLDNYRYENLTSPLGRHLTYLKLVNTRQTSLLPIEGLSSLERLILMYLPQIFRNQPLIRSIKNLKKLKYLDLTNNQLKSIDGLQSKTIDQLDISSNTLEHIHEYTFEYVPKLRVLTLTGNPLESIDKNAFCGIENFEKLHLNIPHANHLLPIDNCLLLTHPNLDIKTDSHIKLTCNCQLVSIYQYKRDKSKEINRLLKPNQLCLVTNETLAHAKDSQQLNGHLHMPIHVYELENYLNCSTIPICQRPCQERKHPPTTLTPIKFHKTHIDVQRKATSYAPSNFTFFSFQIFSLLLAFLYL